MAALKPISIIGGGLAGLTLGIGLRRLGIPVTIWEAGRYPRHRLCGEFMSGRGQEVLARLGLLESFRERCPPTPSGSFWARRPCRCGPCRRPRFAFRAMRWMRCWPTGFGRREATCVKMSADAERLSATAPCGQPAGA